MLNRSYTDASELQSEYIFSDTIHQLKAAVKSVKKNGPSIAILKALSDPTKLSVFFILSRVDELPVSEISEIIGLSQSSISHALADLKKLGLVDCRSCGQLRCYYLKDQPLESRTLLELFNKVFIK